MPLAHTEGGLSASMSRGMKAAAASGGFRTYVLHDRMTRASCFVCKNTEDAVQLARWLEGSVDELRAFLAALDDPSLSKRAKLREVKTHVVGPMCHVLWAWTTGDACGPNMMTRNSYALNMGYVHAAGAREAGARDPRGEHGRRQEAVVRVLPVRAREDGDRGGDARCGDGPARAAHERRRPARALVGGNPRRRRLRDAVGRVHAGLGDRGDLRVQRARTSGWSARARWRTGRHTAPRTAVCTPRSASPGSRWARSAAAPPSPTPAPGSRCSDCAGTGKVHRFAQIVAAAALALEISASSAMATAGSENFFRAHHERGGMR